MAYDIITVGAATRDIFIVSDQFKLIRSPQFNTGVGECMAFGSKIEVDELYVTTGGGATNAAATFASFGFKSAVISRIGDDVTGKAVLSELKDAKIDTSLISKVKGQTAYSTLLTAPGGERTVLVHRGVSSKFTPKDIPFTKIKSKWIYISSLGGNIALVKKIVTKAYENGVKIAWNPGSTELKQGRKKLEPILKLVDLFNINLEEAQLLTGKKTVKQIVKETAFDPDQIFVITDGTKGSYAAYENQIIHSGTTDAKSISRTGAGDAFGSGMVAGLMKTGNLGQAMQIGTLNAEGVIQSLGAKRGILTSIPSANKRNQITVKRI